MGPIPPLTLKENDPPCENDMANDDAFRENNNLEDIDDIIVNGDAFRENINLEDIDDIIVNGDAFRENINLEDIDIDYIIVNGDAFRENINLEDIDDIIPNDDAFRGNINLEDIDDIIMNDNVFRGNNLFQGEDDIIPNDDVFRGYNYFQGEDIIPDGDASARILYISLHQFFDEFEIAVVSCPCLSRPPYDFAAIGLSGNTGILQMGDINNIIPIPQTDFIFDIQSILSSYCYDFFVIGSGFAVKPLMPYNGYLIINAIISANSANVINNSCIVYEDANTGQRISQIINDPNQIKCSMLGNFYFSEGRRGIVIKMRAKGCKILYDIISLIQYSLYFYRQYPIGGVLVIDGEHAILYITLENYPEWFIPNMDVNKWLKLYRLNCMDVIGVAALTNFPFFRGHKSDGSPLLGTHYRFNTFSNYEAAGGFRVNVTPIETEYIFYFNIAQRIYF